MQTLFAILVGKTISFFARSLKLGGGSAAPGLCALKLDPDLVSKLSAEIPKNIIVTGTNGKTTTSRMIAHFAKASGLKVIRNHTGSNLERGIASTLISNSHLTLRFHSGSILSAVEVLTSGKLDFDLGIWELDEAAFNSVAVKLNPDIVVFLNVFRDQLDRYGEVDTVVKNWSKTALNLPSSTTILINGDDQNLENIAKNFKGKTLRFGAEGYKISGESLETQTQGKQLDFEAKHIRQKGLQGSNLSLLINHKSLFISLPLPGIYHIYDAVAAAAVANQLQLPLKKCIQSLKTFTPAFGRVEKFEFPHRKWEGKTIKWHGYIFLIKNPAGATQVFETIAPTLKQEDVLLLALNDNLADGTDVSWIWDVGFEKIKNPASQGEQRSNIKYICSGTRAYDLANRLKYAGFDTKTIEIETDLKKALKMAQKDLKGRLFILPTYTAMLEIQSILTRSGIKPHYWKEEQ